MRSGLFERRDPARRAHHEGLRQPLRVAALAEGAQIPGDRRAEVRVDRGRRRALVFAELGSDLVRCDHVRGRKTSAKLLRDAPLVLRVPVGVEETDRDRLGVDLPERLELERRHLSLGLHPPAHADAALERDEWLGMGRAQPVEMRAVLPAKVQEMLEPGGADKRCPRTRPLEERVRRDRRPVREAVERGAGPDRTSRREH